MGNEWQSDLERALGTDLLDLLATGSDDAAFGIGLLAWIAQAKANKLLRPGGIGTVAVRATDGVPTDIEIPALRHDGKEQGPWTARLRQEGAAGSPRPWGDAVAFREFTDTSCLWLVGGPPGEAGPHKVLAARPDLLRADHVSLGAALRPVLAPIAARQGSVSALLFGVSLADALTTALRSEAKSISMRSEGVTVEGQEMGDWSFECATHDHLGFEPGDVTLRADTSTPEGQREVERMLTDESSVLTSLQITFEGDELTGVATMGRSR